VEVDEHGSVSQALLEATTPDVELNAAILRALYGSRALTVASFLIAPKTELTFFVFAAVIGFTYLLSGDFAAARPMLERLAAAQNPSASGEARQLVEALAGRADRHALALWLAALPHYSHTDPSSRNALQDYYIPPVLMLLGEPNLALAYMERIEGDLGTDVDWAVMLPVMNSIRCEPRFVAPIQKLRTTDPYFAEVCAGKH